MSDLIADILTVITIPFILAFRMIYQISLFFFGE